MTTAIENLKAYKLAKLDAPLGEIEHAAARLVAHAWVAHDGDARGWDSVITAPRAFTLKPTNHHFDPVRREADQFAAVVAAVDAAESMAWTPTGFDDDVQCVILGRTVVSHDTPIDRAITAAAYLGFGDLIDWDAIQREMMHANPAPALKAADDAETEAKKVPDPGKATVVAFADGHRVTLTADEEWRIKEPRERQAFDDAAALARLPPPPKPPPRGQTRDTQLPTKIIRVTGRSRHVPKLGPWWGK